MLFFQAHVSSCQSTHCHAWHSGPDGAKAHSLNTFICANNTSRAQPQIAGVCGPTAMKLDREQWMEKQREGGKERRGKRERA